MTSQFDSGAGVERFAAKLLVCSIALAMTLAVMGFYLSAPATPAPAPTAAALIGICGGGAPLDDWIISGEQCYCEGEDLVINGTIRIDGGSNFTMNNCTFRINSSVTGQYGIFIADDSNFTMLNNSMLTYGDNASAAFTFTGTGDDTSIITINNSVIRGAGFSSSFLNNTGLYITSPNTIIRNTTIRDGYNGIIFNWSSRNLIDNNMIANNSNMGIFLNNANLTNITNNIIMDNVGHGIFLNNSRNVTVYNNRVINNSAGVYFENTDNSSITYNYVYKNRGDGVINNQSITSFPIKFNIILNNSGWGVWTNEPGPFQTVIQNNTMCYNGNTTYWFLATGGGPYTGVPPRFNTFCVNITRPIKGGCTNSDEVQFYVHGNPLSWRGGYPAGMTNCTLYIDDVEKNSTVSFGAYHWETLMFNGTEVGDGSHNLTVDCDPEYNTARDDSDYNRDTQPPYSGPSGTGGECENVTLAVYWLDGTCNVSYAVLSTNETYSYVNYTNGTYGSPKLIEWNQSWSNFSWWNASMEDEWVNWLIWANDSAGNWNSSSNATFQAEPCAVSVVTAVGGGGGGAPAPPPPCSVSGGNMTIMPVKKDQTVSCYLKDAFKLFNITFAVKKDTSSKIVLEETPQPEGVPKPTLATYKYFDIKPLNLTDSDLSKITVEFKVPNDWMVEKNVVASVVDLYRWDGTEWIKQLTTVKLESINNTYFHASFDSIATNIFAIAAGKSCPACPPSSKWSECMDGIEKRTEWTCSEETEFECANFTRTQRCACPETCPQPSEWSECVNDTQTRTVYTCSEETGFECLAGEEARECVLAPPLLLPLPTWEDFQQAPVEVQIAVVAVAIAAIGGAAAAAYWYFRIRERPRPWQKVKRPAKPKLKKPRKRR